MQHVFVEFVTFVKWSCHTNVTNAASKTLAVVHPPLFMDTEDRFAAKQDACCEEGNIATGETSQAITPFHFYDNFKFHH